jgi:hypothetical protein
MSNHVVGIAYYHFPSMLHAKIKFLTHPPQQYFTATQIYHNKPKSPEPQLKNENLTAKEISKQFHCNN